MKKEKQTSETKAVQSANKVETKDKETPTPKKTNRTWEAFGKSKGCFIINDPKFLL